MTPIRTSIRRPRCFSSRTKPLNRVSHLMIWRGQGVFQRWKDSKALLKATKKVKVSHLIPKLERWQARTNRSTISWRVSKLRMIRTGQALLISHRMNRKPGYLTSHQRCVRTKCKWWMSSEEGKISKVIMTRWTFLKETPLLSLEEILWHLSIWTLRKSNSRLTKELMLRDTLSHNMMKSSIPKDSPYFSWTLIRSLT